MTLPITEKKSPLGTILMIAALGIGGYFAYSIFFKKSSAPATDLTALLASLLGSGAAAPSAPSLQYDSNTTGSNTSPYGISYPDMSLADIKGLAVPLFFREQGAGESARTIPEALALSNPGVPTGNLPQESLSANLELVTSGSPPISMSSTPGEETEWLSPSVAKIEGRTIQIPGHMYL